MDLFEKIEEYEHKIQDTISNKLDTFIRFAQDFENYINFEKEIHQDFKLEKNQIEILNEIKLTDRLKTTLLNNGKKLKELKKEKKNQNILKIIGSQKILPKVSVKDENIINPRRSFSQCNFKRNSFSIYNTELINVFDQILLRPSKKYYSKKNELGIMKNKICHAIKKDIRIKFYSVLNERNNSRGKNKLAGIFNSTNSKDFSFERSESKKDFKRFTENTNIVIVKNSKSSYKIDHLLPQAKKQPDFLSTKLVMNKMFEYKYHGMLSKRIDFDELKKQFRIVKNKPQVKINLKKDMLFTEMLINNYLSNKRSFNKTACEARTKEKKLNLDNFDFNFENHRKILMNANTTNYYTVINRDKFNLNLDMRKKEINFQKIHEKADNINSILINNKKILINPNRTFLNNVTFRQKDSKLFTPWVNDLSNRNIEKIKSPKKESSAISKREKVLSFKLKIIKK